MAGRNQCGSERQSRTARMNQSMTRRNQCGSERQSRTARMNQSMAGRNPCGSERQSRTARMNQSIAGRNPCGSERQSRTARMNQSMTGRKPCGSERQSRTARMNQSMAGRNSCGSERQSRTARMNQSMAGRNQCGSERQSRMARVNQSMTRRKRCGSLYYLTLISARDAKISTIDERGNVLECGSRSCRFCMFERCQWHTKAVAAATALQIGACQLSLWFRLRRAVLLTSRFFARRGDFHAAYGGFGCGSAALCLCGSAVSRRAVSHCAGT